MTGPAEVRAAVGRSDFPSRNGGRLHTLDEDVVNEFDLVLPGWDLASRWMLEPDGPGGARLCRDRRCHDPVLVPADPSAPGSVNAVVLALTDHLGLAPEIVAAGMGMAWPHPVLRSPREIAAALGAHDRDDDEGEGERAALRWLNGQAGTRPACGRPWEDGTPDPWQVDAERMIAEARSGQSGAAAPYVGMARQFRWARMVVGGMTPWAGEWSRWLWRRVRGRVQVPPVRAPGTRCTIGRGQRFRSWQVVDDRGLLGTVWPDGPRRRWIATVGGQPVSGRVHDSVIDAAYEVAVAVYRAGWADGSAAES